MKIIITESKLDSIILKYINDEFNVKDIHYTEIMDSDGNPDDSAYEFYLGDYSDDETVFRMYNKHYWVGDGDTDLVRYRIEQSPLLVIDDSNIINKMNGLFNDKWKPVFKRWFSKNFGFNIKTII